MDKEFLFQYMRSRFREAGFTEEETELHISRFSRRYANADDDDIEADLQKHGGASRVIEHIIRQRNSYLESNPQYQELVSRSVIRERQGAAEDAVSGRAVISEVQPTLSPVSDHADPNEATRIRTGQHPTPETRKNTAAEENRGLRGTEHRQDKGGVHPSAGVSGAKQKTAPASDADDLPTKNVSLPPEDMSKTQVVSVPKNKQGGKAPSSDRAAAAPTHTAKPAEKNHGKAAGGRWYSRLPEITYWGEGTEEGYRRFWIIFGFSVPFIAALLLAFSALSIGIIAAVVVGIVALIVLLVAEVAAGSAVSLIGIIYGISQLFLNLPVGLFELGIGVCAVGVTMLAGILIYNLAIRFLPFLLKQYIRFLKFMKKFLTDLFYYVKGECYRK